MYNLIPGQKTIKEWYMDIHAKRLTTRTTHGIIKSGTELSGHLTYPYTIMVITFARMYVCITLYLDAQIAITSHFISNNGQTYQLPIYQYILPIFCTLTVTHTTTRQNKIINAIYFQNYTVSLLPLLLCSFHNSQFTIE